MVFVLLGTNDKPFNRLLEAIEKQIVKGNIKDKVIVQTGFTKFKSDNMELLDLIPNEDYLKIIDKADFIIAHAGVGSILDGLRANKKVIAAPRLKEYGEHVNDHQLEILDEFEKKGYVLALRDFDKLDAVLKKVKTFKPNKYTSNTKNMVKLIEDYIDKM